MKFALSPVIPNHCSIYNFRLIGKLPEMFTFMIGRSCHVCCQKSDAIELNGKTVVLCMTMRSLLFLHSVPVLINDSDVTKYAI